MKILSVVGNRPQFIKSAPLSEALAAAGIDEIVVHTGQHYDDEMSRVFFTELRIPEPAHALGLRTADVTAMTGPIGHLIALERPTVVLVFGDTNSTLAGARAAVAAGVPVAHVEAGLRSGDLSMPEERTRIEVDRLAALLLCPDALSAATLADEDATGRVEIVGDVMADVALRLGPLAREQVPPPHPAGTYAVATVHREANVRPDRLGRIVEGLGRVGLPVVLPAHPRTAATIREAGIVPTETVELRAPMGYLAFASAASQARVILTDSGGLQKEAYWYGVPCVTMRPSTEWVATVEVGANVLVDDDPDAIAAAAQSATFPSGAPALYGDGHASEKVVRALLRL